MDPSYHTNEANPIPTNDNTIINYPEDFDGDDERTHNDWVSLFGMLSEFMEEDDSPEGDDAENGDDGDLYFGGGGDIHGFIEEMMTSDDHNMMTAVQPPPKMNNQNGEDLMMGLLMMGTPASESSIEALEKVTVIDQQKEEGGEEESITNMCKFECPICFEGSSKDPEAFRMPCSHLFHTKCIICWLHARNTCPLCRYEMPTGDETSSEDERCLMMRTEEKWE